MSAAILPNPGNTEYVHPLSIEAYHALGEMGFLGENAELLYGIVYTKMPKSPLHNYLVETLRDLIERALPAGFFVREEKSVSHGDSEPEPDIAVISGSRRDFRDKHPTTAELVIEVAVTSEEYDRNKALAYARAGVKEFWIVLANTQAIEIHRQPVATGYAGVVRVAAGSVAESAAVPGVCVDVAALFAR